MARSRYLLSYGSAGYLAKHRNTGDLAAHQWVGPDDSLAGTSVARWMRSELPESQITLRADSLLGLRQAAQAGLGLAALPCYLGDTSDLVCVHRPIAAMETAPRTSSKWDERPLLIVVARQGRQPTRGDLLGFIKGKIAKWWMVDAG
jgi:DNA-binding transcriptional LysR family regulator